MGISATSTFGNTQTILTADVPNAGTVVVAYPAGTVQTDYTAGNAGLVSDNIAVIGQDKFTGGTLLGYAYGASNITVTNSTGVTWAAGKDARFSFPKKDPAVVYNGIKAVV